MGVTKEFLSYELKNPTKISQIIIELNNFDDKKLEYILASIRYANL